MGDKKGKKVDLGMLKAVYRRGAGAFSTSHRPGMSRQQWSMARVNAFLYLVRNGRPKDAKYVTDNDLLPKGHPKRTDKKSKWLDWDMPGCKCKNHKAEVYEWPDETKFMRLEIEGLAADWRDCYVSVPGGGFRGAAPVAPRPPRGARRAAHAARARN